VGSAFALDAEACQRKALRSAGAEEGAILKKCNIINGLRLAGATPANEDANDKAS
jgi:hypothetical protein